MQKDNNTAWIGTGLYWFVLYVFAILFGAMAEGLADTMSRLALGFAGGDLSAIWRDIPVLFLVAVVLSVGLTWALLTGDKLLGKPLENTVKWFKAFTLVFVFVGSHISYQVIKVMHSAHIPR